MKPPMILVPGKLEEINKYVLDRTGCFAFLVSDRGWNYSEPTTGKGAVELWSVALYVVYHDYGCKYLKFILDQNNKPNTDIDDLLYRSRRHKRTIERILRTNVAHGGLDSYVPGELKKIFFARENTPIDQLSDKKWFSVAERIRQESNDLVDAIYKWADGYQKSGQNIRNRFSRSDEFKKSIDSRLMFDTLDNDFCKGYERRANTIIEKDLEQAPKEKLASWGEEVSSLFLDETLRTPEDIIRHLKKLLYDIHNPMQPSSIDIGNVLGFSFSDLRM